MRIGRLDTFIIIFSSLNDFKAKAFVEFDRILIVDLNMKKDTVKIRILTFDIIEYMFDHHGADAEASVGGKTAKCHDVESAAGRIGSVHPAAHCTNHHIVIVG